MPRRQSPSLPQGTLRRNKTTAQNTIVRPFRPELHGDGHIEPSHIFGEMKHPPPPLAKKTFGTILKMIGVNESV
jgi:hypothetical protein